MFTFLLVLQAIVGAALVTVILMQRSEGGGLGMGGSPSGLMSARGAADFLSRATAILAGVFVLLSIALATLAATRHSTTIDTSLATSAPAPAPTAAAPQTDAAPFAGAAQNAAAPAPANDAAPADNGPVPLQQ
ncbi:protein translocase subunit secG [Hephaestia caeni]|uniref:Protein-export membrane protein SecG n=1 Tax=Hephaestia caeni TaxID=645617 RepID=A0A397PHS3_9SPHN|nr:preprotein translocase subunit SecG [Hephaestia caeni]RIA46815.1 protein translocase subunit secG [Hephaestia caeni]